MEFKWCDQAPVPWLGLGIFHYRRSSARDPLTSEERAVRVVDTVRVLCVTLLVLITQLIPLFFSFFFFFFDLFSQFRISLVLSMKIPLRIWGIPIKYQPSKASFSSYSIEKVPQLLTVQRFYIFEITFQRF